MAADEKDESDYSISGTMAEDVIKDHQGDTSWTVHKQGRTTGREEGYIEAVSASTYALGRIELGDVDRDGGDSGGPYFKAYGDSGDEHCWILGIHNWGNEDNDDKGPAGNMMIGIEDFFGVNVNY